MKHSITIKQKQTGQSSVEYIVVIAAIFLAFTVPLPNFDNVAQTENSNDAFTITNNNKSKSARNPTVIEWLTNVLKRNYEAYSYGVSVAELPKKPN